jgi:hypothetical protein
MVIENGGVSFDSWQSTVTHTHTLLHCVLSAGAFVFLLFFSAAAAAAAAAY